MVDISAVAGALTSLKAVKDIAESMIGLSNAESVRGKVLEIQSKMLDAQAFAFAAQEERTALVERVRDLEKEIGRLEAWDAEKRRYELKEIQTGVWAYALKEGVESGEPHHYLCANCYNRGKKSFLQREVLSVGRVVMQICHECNAELIEQGMRQEAAKPRGRR